jgi:4'-phosphopantetheinyl transferase
LDHIVLKPGEIHFFYTVVDRVEDQILLDRYREISSKKERLKIDRYRFEKDRHNCLVTRALLRFVLSQFTRLPPCSFEFEENIHGKPCLKEGVADIPIRFNLSHAGGLTSCAVVLDHEIGIDVEDSHRKINMSIADRFFSRQESAILKNTKENKKQGVFFDFWTLKESYIKAKGKGLSIPLDQFSFSIRHDSTQISFDDRYDDNADNFSFFRFPLLEKFKAAITVQAPKTRGFNLNIYNCVPFKEVQRQVGIKVI